MTPTQIIIHTVAARADVTASDITGPRRFPRRVRARQMAIAIARDLTGRSLPEIARSFRRDPSTVHNALQRVEYMRARDAAYDADFRAAHAACAIALTEAGPVVPFMRHGAARVSFSSRRAGGVE